MASADGIGVDYLGESNSVVYGGSRYSHWSQNPDDMRILYTKQLRTDETQVLYRGEGILSDVQTSGQGQLIGVLERRWKENVSQERATYVDRRVDEDGRVVEVYYAEESNLVILNLDGVVLATIADVRRYAWDPDGGRIAYITGNYREGGFGFVTSGAWTYDVSARQAEQIYAGGV